MASHQAQNPRSARARPAGPFSQPGQALGLASCSGSSLQAERRKRAGNCDQRPSARQRCRHRQPRDSPGNGDRVGNRLFVEVDEGGDGQQREEQGMAGKLGPQRLGCRPQAGDGEQPGPLDFEIVQRCEPNPRQQLDAEWAQPESSTMPRRLTPQEEPAENRDAIDPATRTPALRRRRPRADLPRLPGQTINAQVQPSPEHAAYRKEHRQLEFDRNRDSLVCLAPGDSEPIRELVYDGPPKPSGLQIQRWATASEGRRTENTLSATLLTASPPR